MLFRSSLAIQTKLNERYETVHLHGCMIIDRHFTMKKPKKKRSFARLKVRLIVLQMRVL
jgi:hypothetical protein